MSSSDFIASIWPAVKIYLIGGLLLLVTEKYIPVYGKAYKLFHQLNTLQSQGEQINIQGSIH